MKKTIRGLLATVLVIVLLSSSFTALCVEQAGADTSSKTNVTAKAVQQPEEIEATAATVDYLAYLDNCNGYKPSEKDIVIKASDFSSYTGDKPEILDEYYSEANILKLNEKATEVTYDFDVSADGLYTFALNYCSVESNNADMSVAAKIDGKYLFDAMKGLTFPRYWKDAEEIRTDSIGNQLIPETTQLFEFTSRTAYDTTNKVIDPYTVALSAGRHTVTLSSQAGSIVLKEIVFAAPEKIDTYKNLMAAYATKNYSNYTGDEIVIEGESAIKKSSQSLVSSIDNGSASISPTDAVRSKINFIGGENWKYTGQSITWKFAVPSDGYYKLGFRYRQNYVLNGNSYRWLKIDGKTPFEEAKCVDFPYGIGWNFLSLGGDKEPELIYLTAGDHEISLEVTLGKLVNISNQLHDVVSSLGDLYVDITMITGESVDTNRDYELFNQVPDFNQRLQDNLDKLNAVANEFASIVGHKTSSNIATIRNLSRTLQSMIDNPYNAHQYVGSYYSNYCSVSSALNEMTSLPLDIDQIVLASPEKDFQNKTAGFFKSAMFSIRRFIASFVNDYGNAANESEEDGDSITLWINWGRDQSRVLSSLIQQTFTPQNNINVNLKVVNASFIQGIISGRGPDCVLMLSRTEPVNYAMRGALYDLSQFPDYNEVLKRFMPGSETPYKYGSGCYALPDTQSFYMMFYRTDIFEKLGLEPPKTWDEFLDVSGVLQRNNLYLSLPYTQITDTSLLSTGIGGLSIYPTLLMQNGQSIYNSDFTGTTLTEAKSVDIFTFWTDLYTKRKFQISLDFYNRFRVGTCPIGIALYSTYATFRVAAPEIDGRWKMVEIPGVRQEDGTINNCETGSGSGCAISSISKNKEAAWKFLKWWTSSDTQLAYANNVEAILGVSARHPTSNIEALKQLPFDSESLESLLSQWSKVEELRELPGGYYMARGIDQAYWNTINGNENPKDMLLKWGSIVDEEIARKKAEYSD